MPSKRGWATFIGCALLFGFSIYNLYCAYAYGAIYGAIMGSRLAYPWITFESHPYRFGFYLLVYVLIVALFGIPLVRIILGRKPL